MKKQPLFAQILIVFTAVICLMGAMILIFVRGTLNEFFTSETYATIEASQQTLTSHNEPFQTTLQDLKQQQNLRSVQHVFLGVNGEIANDTSLPNNVLNFLYKQAISQDKNTQRYKLNVHDQEMLYAIRKIRVEGEGFYQISYMWDSYRQQLVKTLFKRIFLVSLIVLLCGILIAFFFSKWLAKPIVEMKQHVQRIANRKWDSTLETDRSDEIGVLAHSIDEMRVQLKKQDEAQQSMLQNISHDLKTPIMVIRSYTEALRDGIHPNGTFESTLETIDGEANRLESKIKDLLYLTKLDYVSQQNQEKHKVEMDVLVKAVVQRLRTNRPGVSVNVACPSLVVYGQEEHFRVMCENMLDNALKYAKEHVSIRLEEREETIFLSFYNDGPHIEENLIQRLFQPFQKGDKGNFGLGLAIVKRLVTLYEGEISVENNEQGVLFLLEFPNQKQ
ncbi:sensor histidine kinase [Priestia endophytica]|uniref:sensor histidine kinase n=1 Tax=Priestia endophytica TaxID=135735 RepID=UPI002E2411D7|nr:HAMP domain-containing sensor histidine kinase [Priestia endophytica]